MFDPLTASRFWSHVDKSGQCWLWKGEINKRHGYGRFYYKRRKTIRAHRYSWWLANQDFRLTAADYICHTCDVRACVNPAHLFLGNALSNAADCKNKNRQKKGSEHGMAVLTEDKVRQIRSLRQAGIKRKEVAQKFGVSEATIKKITSGQYWKHA
jgi:hypothetical protein